VAEAMGVVDTAWSLGTCGHQTPGLLARVFGGRAGVPQRHRVNLSALHVCRSLMLSILLYSEERAVLAASIGSESIESVHVCEAGDQNLRSGVKQIGSR
jgi:hypothetical protein